MIDLHFRKKKTGVYFNKITETVVANLLLRTFTRKNSTTQVFFILWLQSDNELPMSEMQKNWGVTDFVFEINRVENYPSFDKLAPCKSTWPQCLLVEKYLK